MVDILGDGFLMGTAFLKQDTNVILADESVYKLLGQNFSLNLIDFIHPDCRDGFTKALSRCFDGTASVFLAKCLCGGTEYRDMVFSAKGFVLNGSSYIDISLYDIGEMSVNYFDALARNTMLEKYESMYDQLFFVYNVHSDTITVTQNGKTTFSGKFDDLRVMIAEGKYIDESSKDEYERICNAVRAADGSGFHTINTSLFSDTYSRSSVRYSVVGYNFAPTYTVGCVSGIDFYDFASRDPLTGILNKRKINALAEQALKDRQNGRVIYIIIDLDHFKEINDTYGHMAGDKALKNAARIIKDVVGCRGCVGRIGGDEFFVLLPDFMGDNEDLRMLLRSIKNHIRWHFMHSDEDIKVTCSIGAAAYPEDARNFNDLFKLADHCLYRAKTKGRNRFVFYVPEIHGSPDEIINGDMNMQFSGFATEEDKTAHLLNTIRRINETPPAEYPQLMQTLLSETAHNYNVNLVQYIPADSGAKCCEYSDRQFAAPHMFDLVYKTYSEKINGRGHLALGNYENSEKSMPLLTECMEKNKLRSVFMLPCSDESGRLKGVFTLASDIQNTWSEFDINILTQLLNITEHLA